MLSSQHYRSRKWQTLRSFLQEYREAKRRSAADLNCYYEAQLLRVNILALSSHFTEHQEREEYNDIISELDQGVIDI